MCLQRISHYTSQVCASCNSDNHNVPTFDVNNAHTQFGYFDYFHVEDFDLLFVIRSTLINRYSHNKQVNPLAG